MNIQALWTWYNQVNQFQKNETTRLLKRASLVSVSGDGDNALLRPELARAAFYLCGQLTTHSCISFIPLPLFLAPQSGALRINAYRDFLPSHPIPYPIPLIAFEHLSLSMVIRNSASRPRQINVDQERPKQVSTLRNFPNFPKFSKFSKIFQIFQNFPNFPKKI